MLARKPDKRVGPQLWSAEIEKMIGVVVPTGDAPGVRIVHPEHELLAMPLKKWSDLGWQLVDRQPHDVLMRRRAPGEGRDRYRQQQEQHRTNASSHPR